MARKFQFKRGKKADLPTLAAGEPGFVTDEGKLYVGTGSANIPMARDDHTHTPASIGAAAASHGTHVTYSTTAPVMDGTAAAGSAATVARSDHKHPTDTSRAAASHTHDDRYYTESEINTKLEAKEGLLKDAAAKTTMADADTIPLTDSAASSATKKITWANLIAAIKSKLNSVYAAASHTHTPAQAGLGNVPNVKTNDQAPTFTAATTRANLTSGEKLTLMLGKLAKWFTDLKTVAWTGNYNDLTNKPAIPTVPSTLPPSGAAGGDLSGSYPNPSVKDNSHAHTVANVTGLQSALDGKEALLKNAPAKTSLADADNLPLSDSAASSTTKKITWANVKAAIKAWADGIYALKGHKHGAGDITSGTLPATRGGTGYTTLQATRNAMGLGNTTGAVPVANGGTGATTAAAALTALGGAAASHTHDDRYYPSELIDEILVGSYARVGHVHTAGNIASGTLAIARGGTGVTGVGGTDYTTVRFRGSGLRSSDTNPGENGTINWTYG